MRPVVEIWIGTDKRIGIHDLPEPVMEALDEEEETIEDGILFQYFSCADEYCGFGVELFQQYHFDFNRFDIESLYRKAKELKPQIEKIFKKWNIKGEVGIYITTDARSNLP